MNPPNDERQDDVRPAEQAQSPPPSAPGNTGAARPLRRAAGAGTATDACLDPGCTRPASQVSLVGSVAIDDARPWPGVCRQLPQGFHQYPGDTQPELQLF